MDITNIFCQSLGVTSHENISYGLPFSNGFGICLNGSSGYPFKKNCHPFERLGLSVWKKLSSVRTAWAIHLKQVVIRSNGLGYPFEKIVNHSNGSGYPLKKNLATVRATEAICSKINFSQVSSQNHFIASHSRRTSCYSPGHARFKFCLQTYHIWIVTHLCSFVAI